MFNSILKIFELPWAGAKVILKVVTISSILSSHGYEYASPEVSLNKSKLFLKTTLKDSFKPKIKKLILNSTIIQLEHKLSFNNKEYDIKKIFKYDPFLNKISMTKSKTDSVSYLKPENLKQEFEAINFIIREDKIENSQEVTLKLESDIKIISENSQIKDIELWEENPVMIFKTKLRDK